MKLVALLVASLSAACAAHNAHRIPIDLNADLAPLIDEAWTQMEETSGAPVPVGGVPVEVSVEPVVVQWLPFSQEVPPGNEVIAQPELQSYIEHALAVTTPPADAGTPPGEVGGRHVRVSLAADLHEPNALEIQILCDLVELAADGKASVRGHGCSPVMRFDRLYCHGCRDHWSGHGSKLGVELGEGGSYVDAGVGVVFFDCPSPSAGYIKH